MHEIETDAVEDVPSLGFSIWTTHRDEEDKLIITHHLPCPHSTSASEIENTTFSSLLNHNNHVIWYQNVYMNQQDV